MRLGELVFALAEDGYMAGGDAIRYYERLGLIKPKRTKGNHRVYDEFDVNKIKFILRLRDNNIRRKYIVRALRGEREAQDKIKFTLGRNKGNIEDLLGCWEDVFGRGR